MWWFARKVEQAFPVAETSWTRQVEDQLLAMVPDLCTVASRRDSVIRLWLPEVVARTVKWCAAYEGESQSVWLRERLMAYVYGCVTAQALRIRHQRLEHDEPRPNRRPGCRTHGRWVYKVPQLGEDIVAFQLRVSSQMRTDLQALADHAQLHIAAFAREAIIAELLGRASLPGRAEILGQPTPAAEAWERGEDVPILELEQEPPDGLGEPELVWQEQA